ncbi:MAG TPA: hypothetical protein PKI46_00065, partial [Bacteroidales bacterium]|nr:hypothetical protein [Bacteroidales bacterium]
NDIQLYIKKLPDNENKYYNIRLVPYFKDLFKYNLFDEYSGVPFIIENGKGYKNNMLDYYSLRTFKLYKTFKQEYNAEGYPQRPIITQENNIIKIKDIWEMI